MNYFDLVNEKHIAQEKFAEECEYNSKKMIKEATKTAFRLAENYKIEIKFRTPDKDTKDSNEKILFENIK